MKKFPNLSTKKKRCDFVLESEKEERLEKKENTVPQLFAAMKLKITEYYTQWGKKVVTKKNHYIHDDRRY